MAKEKPVFIGEIDGKEYYRQGDQYLWRVPDTREGVQAPYPGWSLVGADYSQIEIRLMAFLSQDTAMIATLNSLRDFHTSNLAKLNGYDYETINKIVKAESDLAEFPQFLYQTLKDERSDIKKTSFGVPYGAGPSTVALQIRRKDKKRLDWPGGREPIEEAQKRAEQQINGFFEQYPELKAWLENQGEFALTYGFTRSAKGRIRWYPKPEKSDPNYNKLVSQIKRWAGNHPIQSSSADILKTALPRIYRAFREDGKMNGRNLYSDEYGGARIMLVVHDEIVCTAPTIHIHKVAEILKREMEWAYNSIAMDMGGMDIRYMRDISNKVDVTKASDHWIH
jgi:DNA polymerase-1